MVGSIDVLKIDRLRLMSVAPHS